MLTYIEIQNFKKISNARIEGLKRVNLFTGKNNLCKTTLLEAIYLHKKDFDLKDIQKLLVARKELNFNSQRGVEEIFDQIKAVGSLFTRRPINQLLQKIVIKSDYDYQTFYFTKRLRISEKTGDEETIRFITDDPDFTDPESISIIIENTKGKSITSMIRAFYPTFRTISVKPNFHRDVIFVKSFSSYNGIDSLWDNVVLGPLEGRVVEALKVIEPEITGLAFVDAQKERRVSDRIPVVRIEGYKETYPLASFGDGINRILEIILCMVNAENGCVLIDEVENGLHYTVQTKLWEIIFNLAHELNVQVFATTHSSDAVAAFSTVAYTNNEKGEQYKDDGAIHKLLFSDDTLYSVPFTEEEAYNATRNHVELR